MNNHIKSIVSTANKAAAASFHTIGREISTVARSAGGAVRNTVKTAIANRIQQQKNFENRADNSNYYGTARSFNKP